MARLTLRGLPLASLIDWIFMTYPAHKDDGRVDHVHNAALRKAIGERLASSLNQKPVAMPLHLIMLMERLRDEPPGTLPDANP
jgi:hypothetical protein